MDYDRRNVNRWNKEDQWRTYPTAPTLEACIEPAPAELAPAEPTPVVKEEERDKANALLKELKRQFNIQEVELDGKTIPAQPQSLDPYAPSSRLKAEDNLEYLGGKRKQKSPEAYVQALDISEEAKQHVLQTWEKTLPYEDTNEPNATCGRYGVLMGEYALRVTDYPKEDEVKIKSQTTGEVVLTDLETLRTAEDTLSPVVYGVVKLARYMAGRE